MRSPFAPNGQDVTPSTDTIAPSNARFSLRRRDVPPSLLSAQHVSAGFQAAMHPSETGHWHCNAEFVFRVSQVVADCRHPLIFRRYDRPAKDGRANLLASLLTYVKQLTGDQLQAVSRA